MNLSKLFELQRQLDERIEKEHPHQPGEDRLMKKIVALLVELGELANEVRFFKFWSYYQEPRNFRCTKCGGYGYWFQGTKRFHCGSCGGKGFVNKVLEEYVDGLHFLLSIGLEENIGILNEVDVSKSNDLTFQFLELFDAISNLPYDISEYPYIFGLYLGLGEMLGFTWEEIEEAYLQKNRENFRRQEEGY